MMPTILRLVGALMLLAGCATPAPDLDAGIRPDGRTSLVVGRAELVHNGYPMHRGVMPDKYPHLIVSYIRPFTAISDVTTGALAPPAGSVAARARLSDDGFFAVALPPGRYYYDRFMYTSIAAPLAADFQTQATSNRQRSIILFEVLPGKATYIGSVRHEVRDLPASAWDTGRKRFNFELRLADESAAARQWVAGKLPAWVPHMVTQGAQMQPM